MCFGIREGGFQGWSKSRAELAARLPADMPHGRAHDIRRSVATGMAELGVLPHVIEACLNHLSGHKKGVAGDLQSRTTTPLRNVRRSTSGRSISP